MKPRDPREGAQSAICPDCKGSGRLRNVPCAPCGGVGRLYRLATPGDGEAWLSAAMMASALGKDPFDAAVIATITDSAVLGVFLADDEGSQSPTDESAATSEPEADTSPADDDQSSSSEEDSSSGNDD